MFKQDAIVAVHGKHDAAEAAILHVAEAGIDMKNFSIVGKGYRTEERVIALYSAGPSQVLGQAGAYRGGL